jgi:hypothetical protein
MIVKYLMEYKNLNQTCEEDKRINLLLILNVFERLNKRNASPIFSIS